MFLSFLLLGGRSVGGHSGGEGIRFGVQSCTQVTDGLQLLGGRAIGDGGGYRIVDARLDAFNQGLGAFLDGGSAVNLSGQSRNLFGCSSHSLIFRLFGLVFTNRFSQRIIG
jgi:hypothetical protein